MNESVTCNSSNALAGGRTEPEIVDRRSKLVSQLVERELVFFCCSNFLIKKYFLILLFRDLFSSPSCLNDLNKIVFAGVDENSSF